MASFRLSKPTLQKRPQYMNVAETIADEFKLTSPNLNSADTVNIVDELQVKMAKSPGPSLEVAS